jgi:hypothetical protein
MPIDWNEPAARFRLIGEVGAQRYNELLAEHMRTSTVATAGGHAIRMVHSARFGRLFRVGETGRTFVELAKAEAHAKKCPKETPAPAPRAPLPAVRQTKRARPR